MNRFTFTFLVGILVAPLLSHATTIKITVDGMVCAFCAQGIERRLRAQAATADVYVSLKHKLVAVALRPGTDIADATLRAELKDAGYDVRAISRVDERLETLRRGRQ
jgi:copper chaperone CopZ